MKQFTRHGWTKAGEKTFLLFFTRTVKEVSEELDCSRLIRMLYQKVRLLQVTQLNVHRRVADKETQNIKIHFTIFSDEFTSDGSPLVSACFA